MGTAIIWAAASIINYLASEIRITDSRILGKVGFLSPKLIDISLSERPDASVEQGALGRSLGYGAMELVTGGAPRIKIKWMAEPELFKQALEKETASIPDHGLGSRDGRRTVGDPVDEGAP